MNEPTSPKWVPASLVRIRCFLNRRGMKVKPWLGPEAILEAFYAAMRSHTGSDEFWKELEQLLRDLASDMNQRVAARGWVIQNELLDQTAHAELLSEIRRALGREAQAQQGLRPLAITLPRRAAALLLMLAAAIVVGCGGESESVQPGSGTNTQTASGGSSAQGGAATGAQGGTATSKTQAAFGGNIVIDISTNTSSPQSNCRSAATSELDPDHFAACNPKLVETLVPYDIHSDSGKQLLECICVLNDAWQTGFAELFAGGNCAQIADYFGACGIEQLCSTEASRIPAEFDAEQFADHCAVPLYLGVRCD